MRKMVQPIIIGLMLLGVVAIGSAFAFKALALLSWLVAIFAIFAASVVLLRQPYSVGNEKSLLQDIFKKLAYLAAKAWKVW